MTTAPPLHHADIDPRIDPGVAHVMRTAARVLAGLTFAMAGVVLIAWLVGIDWLKGFSPSWPTMKFNTALCFVLVAGALWSAKREPVPAAVRAVAGLAALVAAVTLLEYLAGWNLRIDEWLVQDDAQSVATAAPGRMSVPTAVNFASIGLAVILLDVEIRGTRPAQVLALVTAVIALFATVGYLYDVSSLTGVALDTKMAVHTAALFFAAACAVLAARPERGLMAAASDRGAGGTMIRRLLPVAVAAPLAMGWLRLIGQDAGLFGVSFGISVLVVTLIVTLCVVIWWNGVSLNRSDEARRESEERAQLMEALHAADEERRRAEMELERFFEVSPDLLCIASKDGFFKRLSPSWEATLGYSAQELMSRPYFELIHPDDQDDTASTNNGLSYEGRDVISFENRYRHKDGGYRVLSWSCRAAESGEELLYAVARDVTEAKRAEEALARQAELERSNAELEQFAYVASHDLQEPLRMVASYTQLLERRYGDRLDDAAHEYIEFAVDGANRMQVLINDLLAYSRVSTRGADLETTNAGEVISGVLAELRGMIEERSAVVTVDELPAVAADRVQLAQLFRNLISNALKFQGEMAPRIHVSAKQNDRALTFSVRDNGIGIAPEHRHRIFAIFQRLHSRSEYAGTGIGLAICKRIVERHGGDIWLESEVGQGSVFRFTLFAPEPQLAAA